MKTEAETRKELIDTKLYTAGWDVNNLTQVSKEFDISVPLPDGVAEARTSYEGHQYSRTLASHFQLRQQQLNEMA